MLAAAVLLTLSACGGGDKKDQPAEAGSTPTTGTTSSATASPGPSATASATADPGGIIEFSVDGAGPYALGATLTELQAEPGLTEVKTGATGCPQNTSAHGTGVWQDVDLSFHADGKLYLAVNRSTRIPTPSGAWLGSKVVDLKKIYAGVSGQDLARGTNKAFLVTTVSGRGILFNLDAAGLVATMTAGDAAYLKTNFQSGSAFC